MSLVVRLTITDPSERLPVYLNTYSSLGRARGAAKRKLAKLGNACKAEFDVIDENGRL